MSGNIMIRKARNNYVCDCCGHIIRQGTEYLDKVILNNGKCVQHSRYHDECPHDTRMSRLFAKIELNNGDLIAVDGEGSKIHIIGVAWYASGPVFIFRDWAGSVERMLPIDCVYNLIDEHGNPII